MRLQIRNLAGLLLLTGALVMPSHLSSGGLGYHEAAAAAGGNGKGKGQGADRAGTNGSKGATASAGGLAKGQNYDVNGRINALVKSNAWNNPNSQIGKIALALTAAFETYLTAASTSAASQTVSVQPELVSLLATISNKELSQEDLDAIKARIAQENDDPLFQALVDPTLATTNPQLETTLQGFDQSLIAAVNAVEETNQGLGPIY